MSHHHDTGVWGFIKLIAMILIVFMLIHTDHHLDEKYEPAIPSQRK